jgi:hypothetical protein
MSSGQVRAHFDASFLAEVSPAVLNHALEAVTGMNFRSRTKALCVLRCPTRLLARCSLPWKGS